MKFLISYLSALIPMIAIDVVWLNLMSKRFYSQYLGHLFADKAYLLPAVIFYLLYALGITILVITPAIEGKFSITKLFLTGALFGLVAYGTYDLTNQATLKNWPTIVTVIDLIWGALMTGAVSIIAFYLTRRFS